jgi:hypothetical protein
VGFRLKTPNKPLFLSLLVLPPPDMLDALLASLPKRAACATLPCLLPGCAQASPWIDGFLPRGAPDSVWAESPEPWRDLLSPLLELEEEGRCPRPGGCIDG